MAIQHGYGKLAGTDALVFAYDTGDTRNSFKGEPIENILALGGSDTEAERSGTSYPYYSINIDSYIQERWTPENNILTLSYEGKRDYVAGGTGGGNDGYPVYYIYFTDWSWASTRGISAYDWAYTKQTFTMPDPSTKSVRFAIYHMNAGNRGRSYSRKHMLTFGDHAVPFVNGVRSETEGLLDLTGNRLLNLSTVSFNSAADMIFDGTDDMIELTDNPQNGATQASWEFVTKFDLIHDSETSTYRQLYIQESSVWIGQYFNYIGLDIKKDNNVWFDGNGGRNTNSKMGPVNSGQYYHVVITWDGTNAKGYLNGELNFTTPISGLTSLRNGSTPRRIGRRSGNPLMGEMPIVKLYTKALTAAEAVQNFNHYKTRFNIA